VTSIIDLNYFFQKQISEKIYIYIFYFIGYSHLIFKNTGNHFTWKKVTTLVNNIIVGKLWIDNVNKIKFNSF